MSDRITPAALGDALSEQLGLYHAQVTEKVNAAGETAIKDMVKRAKAKVPKRTGQLKKDLTWKALPSKTGLKTFVLHAKAPSHRILHLVANGHAKADGGRVDGDPFLRDAVDAVLPEYEHAVEEALKND